MIGNDIVDLHLAAVQSNWQRKGFLYKVFTRYERELIFNSAQPFLMVWRLWSMKESAYKVYTRHSEKRFFSPKKISCELIAEKRGRVIINTEKYVTQSLLKNNYIHTIASVENCQKTHYRCFNIENTSYIEQHRGCCQQVKKAISKRYELALEKIQIQKNSRGIPQCYYHNKELPVFVSISHHGNFGAYALA